jgi:hypothetical protein
MDISEIERQKLHDQYVREALNRAAPGDKVIKEYTNDGDRIAIINNQDGNQTIVEELPNTEE